MRVDATSVQLRPRSMFEAADLGVRLVQLSRADLLRTVLPLYVLVAALLLALFPLAPWLPSLALWWSKPWLDRAVLFVLSRALFRERTLGADLWAARGAVFWQGLLASVTSRRLSPWRSFTQGAVQLEGLRGAALRKRCAQLRNGHQGSALGMTWVSSTVETVLTVGIPALLVWLVPGGASFAPLQWISGSGEGATSLLFTVAYLVAVAVVEPFYVGAGFGMYINRRVELEAWDVEQALRHAFEDDAAAASGEAAVA